MSFYTLFLHWSDKAFLGEKTQQKQIIFAVNVPRRLLSPLYLAVYLPFSLQVTVAMLPETPAEEMVGGDFLPLVWKWLDKICCLTWTILLCWTKSLRYKFGAMGCHCWTALEHKPSNQEVVGSNPARRFSFILYRTSRQLAMTRSLLVHNNEWHFPWRSNSLHYS